MDLKMQYNAILQDLVNIESNDWKTIEQLKNLQTKMLSFSLAFDKVCVFKKPNDEEKINLKIKNLE